MNTLQLALNNIKTFSLTSHLKDTLNLWTVNKQIPLNLIEPTP